MPRIGSRFAQYQQRIARLPVSRELTRDDLLKPRFRLEVDGRIEIYYVPFDWVRPSARVIVVGITPGFAQMRLAYQTAAQHLRDGTSPGKALQAAKNAASFGGPMRATLVGMLDAIGLPRHLGIGTTSLLWTSSHCRLLQPTSVIRYAVFHDGKNYAGSSPKIMRHPLLRRYAETEFVHEIARVPHALILPLGKSVKEVLAALVAVDRLDAERILFGLPHPSGSNNGHRLDDWGKQQGPLTSQAAAWFRKHPPA